MDPRWVGELDEAERMALLYVALGWEDERIGLKFGLTKRKVETRISVIRGKLRVAKRAGMGLYFAHIMLPRYAEPGHPPGRWQAILRAEAEEIRHSLRQRGIFDDPALVALAKLLTDPKLCDATHVRLGAAMTPECESTEVAGYMQQLCDAVAAASTGCDHPRTKLTVVSYLAPFDK